MSGLKLTTIEVPVELVKKSCGLAIDHGSSTFKAVYVSKENSEAASKKDAGTSPISVLVVDGTKFEEGLEHLSKNAVINKELAAGGVYTTGLFCTLNTKQISEKLNVKIENLSEYDVIIKALRYLADRLPRSQLLYDQDPARVPKPYIMLDIAKSVLADPKTAMTGLNPSVLDNPKSVIEAVDASSKIPLMKAEKDFFPCLYVHSGSGNDFIQVNADGTFTLLDGSGRGGISFRGLASILTGCQDSEELLKLAEKGNPKAVDLYTDAFDEEAAATKDDSMYTKTMAAEASAIYGFGKCVGAKLGDFKKEDLARALLDQFVTDIVQTTMTVCSAAGLKRVCMGGNFVSSKLVRDLMTDHVDRRNLYYKFTGKPTIRIDFLRSCAHIGAIGALVAQHEKHSTKM